MSRSMKQAMLQPRVPHHMSLTIMDDSHVVCAGPHTSEHGIRTHRNSQRHMFHGRAARTKPDSCRGFDHNVDHWHCYVVKRLLVAHSVRERNKSQVKPVGGPPPSGAPPGGGGNLFGARGGHCPTRPVRSRPGPAPEASPGILSLPVSVILQRAPAAQGGST